MQTDTHIIIVAAGSGSRFGADRPKQFCLLGGRPLLMETIDALRRGLPGASMSLVLSASMVDFWAELCDEYSFETPPIVAGGATRFESVRNALAVVPPAARVVMVHDGVRPFVSSAMLSRLAECGVDGMVPVVSVVPSLRRMTADGASEPVDRALYMEVQTPQAFPADLIKQAYDCEYRSTFTDDASVVEAFTGRPVALTDGAFENIKITRPIDMVYAEAIMTARHTTDKK